MNFLSFELKINDYFTENTINIPAQHNTRQNKVKLTGKNSLQKNNHPKSICYMIYHQYKRDGASSFRWGIKRCTPPHSTRKTIWVNFKCITCLKHFKFLRSENNQLASALRGDNGCREGSTRTWPAITLGWWNWTLVKS